MKIETDWQSTPQVFMAYDADTYDGAPDSNSDCRGYGKTEREAINDFVAQLLERERATLTPREEREYAAECEYDRRKDDALVERAENQMRDRK